MEKSIEPILNAIRGLTDAHRELIEIGDGKREALRVNDVESIAAFTMRENRSLQRLQDQELARQKAVAQYLYQSGMTPTPSFRMEQLIRMVYRTEEKQALIEAAQELKEAIDRLRDINDFNQQLLRLNLEFNQLSYDLLAGPPEEDATYHRMLQDQGFNRRGKFDTRA